MTGETCFLLLGSNIGDRKANILKAIERIKKISAEPLVISGFYETEPWGFNAHEAFYNLAIKFHTMLAPEDLLKYLLNVEDEIGRIREINSSSYSSRPIDIDIIFYGNLILEKRELIIPHPRMHLRRFALVPLCELDSSFVHPIFKKSLKDILNSVDDSLDVKFIGNND